MSFTEGSFDQAEQDFSGGDANTFAGQAEDLSGMGMPQAQGPYTELENLNASAGNIISNPFGTTGVPSTTDPTGNAAPGSAGTLGSTTGWANILTILENYAERGGLIILAIVVIGVGLIAFLRGENPGAVVSHGTRAIGKAVI
jgi:hypothetical protein